MSAVLEIRDGMAVGPMHIPAPHKYLGNGNVKAPFNPDEAPLLWPTMCGTEGYVYDRDGLVAYENELKDCFQCRVLVARDADPVFQVRACAECGGPVTRNRRLCRACYLARPAPECGTRSSYVLGCRCPACTAAERDYAREYNRRRRLAA